MIDDSFVEAIKGLVRESQALRIHKSADHPSLSFVQKPDGTVERLEVEALPRAHRIDSFDSLVVLLADDLIAPGPEVYVGEFEIEAILNRLERRSTVEVRLRATTRWQRACRLEDETLSASPRDICKVLREDFHASNTNHIQDALKVIEFRSARTRRSTSDHGADDLGVQEQASVTQAKDVPREFVINVPVWDNPGFNRYSVPLVCALGLNTEKECIDLRVLPDETRRGLGLARESLWNDLREAFDEEGKDIPVFLGSMVR